MNARKHWLKKKGPQQIPPDGLRRKQEPRPSSSKRKPRARKNKRKLRLQKKTAPTILETVRRSVPGTIRHARLHPRNAATRTAHSAVDILFAAFSCRRL